MSTPSQVTVYEFTPGNRPLLLSMPHCGTDLPGDVAVRMTPLGRSLLDTDWHVDRLYRFAAGFGISLLRPLYSRYLIDLNRPPDDAPLYPGTAGSGLCPIHSFDGEALYLPDQEPGAEEIAARRVVYWQPYHDALQAELRRLKQQHERIVLFEAHSIRSQVPRLFEGELPDLNLGNNDGASCAADMLELASGVLAASAYTVVSNARFKGGHITRAYGQPAAGVHALQLELSQRNYMQESAPFTYLADRAGKLQEVLSALLQALLTWSEGR